MSIQLISAAKKLQEVDPQSACQALAVRIGNRLADLSLLIEPETLVSAITPSDHEALTILRHSASHIMAEAVRELFPGVKIAIGPVIENGFYYDFEYVRPFTFDDLLTIEKKMFEIIKANFSFSCHIVPVTEALAIFLAEGEKYKVDLIKRLNLDKISLYSQGKFTDLCHGPHIPTTGIVDAFKLLSVAGAYWRGDERNVMLSRIYGVAFFRKKELKKYICFLEEAKRRDHRKLGKQLELFSFHEEIGGGLVVWHPRGMLLRYLIENFERREHLKRGYHLVEGPQILKLKLWERSGHFDHYRENMYFTKADGTIYGIKPMNCLAHIFIYKSKVRSYRDLPLRYFELGTVHRREKRGVMHGLTRVKSFTQDDAHIICTSEQIGDEILNVMKFITEVMTTFGFDYQIKLSTRPRNSIGSDEDWERATVALIAALKKNGCSYEINEGDGAFYGPKIDINLKDALNREWQCGTIQCDFTLPDRFDLHYVSSDGFLRRPVMLHRVIFGSYERFIGILIEHYAGAFPLWLAPEQVSLFTVTSQADNWAREVEGKLNDNGFRVKVNLRSMSLSAKVHEAQVFKVPYMLILGEREVSNKLVTPRLRSGQNLEAMSIENFIARLTKEVQSHVSV